MEPDHDTATQRCSEVFINMRAQGQKYAVCSRGRGAAREGALMQTDRQTDRQTCALRDRNMLCVHEAGAEPGREH